MVEELIADGMSPEDIVTYMMVTFGYPVEDAWLQVNTAMGLPGDVLESVEDAEYEDDVDDDDAELVSMDHFVAAAFDESKHRRFEAGRREGGRFAPKDGTSTAVATAEAEDQAKAAQADERVEAMTVEQMNAFELVNGDPYKLGKMGNVELEQYRVYMQAQADRNYGGAGDLYQAEADLAALTQTQRGADEAYYQELKTQERPGEVGNVRRMELNSTNPVYIGKLDGQTVVVKPEMQLSSTRLRTYVEPGFDLEREQAAAHVAGLLREVDPSVAPLVPAYRVLDVEGYGRSGVSDYLPGSETMAEAHKGNRVGTGGRRDKIDEGIPKIRLFDGIVGNTDRHEANLMFNIDNDLVAIDHGLAFPSYNQEDWPSLQRGALTTSLEPAQRSALEQLRQKVKADPVLPTLLTADQIQAMDDRITFMLANDRLPTTDDWQKGLGK